VREKGEKEEEEKEKKEEEGAWAKAAVPSVFSSFFYG